MWHFDLPPIRACPGRSEECEAHCYGLRGRYVFPQVKERLEWCFEMSKRKDFTRLLADEIYRKGILVVRFHVVGDLYSPGYAEKVRQVVEQSSHCTFFLYTRSYTVPAILPVIRDLAKLPNMSVWLSADRSMGLPCEVPEGCRVAWMMVEENETVPEGVDLLFRLRELRKKPLPLPLLPVICPTETPEGKRVGTSCATCKRCWK
ncbi:MAG: hypothetical protein K8U57_35875 [Planctomycetes bacterium]|nr:hypothetical protein [Planctomycetota bacterium]